MNLTPLSDSPYRFSKDADFVSILQRQLERADKTAPARLFFERLAGNYGADSQNMASVAEVAAEFFDRAVHTTDEIPVYMRGDFNSSATEKFLSKRCTDEDRDAFRWMVEDRNDPRVGRRSFLRTGLALATTGLIAGAVGARATLRPIGAIANNREAFPETPANQPIPNTEREWRRKYQSDMAAIMGKVDRGSVMALLGGAFAMVGLMAHHFFGDLRRSSKFTHSEKEAMVKDTLSHLNELLEKTRDVQSERGR